MDTWLSHESKRGEAFQQGRAAINKLNSIKARLRNARSEIYCSLQVCAAPTPSLSPSLSYALSPACLTLPFVSNCDACQHPCLAQLPLLERPAAVHLFAECCMRL